MDTIILSDISFFGVVLALVSNDLPPHWGRPPELVIILLVVCVHQHIFKSSQNYLVRPTRFVMDFLIDSD